MGHGQVQLIPQPWRGKARRRPRRGRHRQGHQGRPDRPGQRCPDVEMVGSGGMVQCQQPVDSVALGGQILNLPYFCMIFVSFLMI